MPVKYPFRLCKIRDYDKSLDKVWHVEYYIFDLTNQKLIRRRVTLSEESAKKRYATAKQVIADIDPLLKSGAVTNVPEEKKKVASDIKTLEELDADTLSLKKACKYFLEFNKSILKIRTYETYSTDITRFTNFQIRKSIEDLPLKDFDTKRAMQFLDELIITDKVSNRSRNNAKGTISTLFNFFKKRKIISDNPFLDIQKLNHVSTKHTAFSKKQAADFKEMCISKSENQLLLFISFIYYCFLRPRYELRLLKVGDIKEKTILVKGENAKDNATEHVMIPAAFEKMIVENELRKYPEHFYVFGTDGQPGEKVVHRHFFYHKHRHILESLNLTGLKIDTYSWKHTGVIALFLATQNIELIRQQCRHSDIATTQNYLRDLGLFIDYDQINKFPEF